MGMNFVQQGVGISNKLLKKNNYVIVAVKTDQRCTSEQHSYVVGSSHSKILQFRAAVQPK